MISMSCHYAGFGEECGELVEARVCEWKQRRTWGSGVETENLQSGFDGRRQPTVHDELEDRKHRAEVGSCFLQIPGLDGLVECKTVRRDQAWCRCAPAGGARGECVESKRIAAVEEWQGAIGELCDALHPSYVTARLFDH